MKLIERADKAQALLLIRADGQALLNAPNAVADIEAAGAPGIPLLPDGLPDLIGDELDIAVRIVADGRIHRAAVVVPQHQDQRAAQMLRGVLDAAQLVIVDDVARHADHKQLPDPGAEQALRQDAGIGAADHNGIGLLPLLAAFQPQTGGHVAQGRLPGEKGLVSAPELRQRLLGRTGKSNHGFDLADRILTV